MKIDYIDSQVTTNLPLEEGKVIRVRKHRRRKSIPKTRKSWEETVAVPPNRRVNNFFTESV